MSSTQKAPKAARPVMTTRSQIWGWKASSKTLYFKNFKLRILGLLGREVTEPCAQSIFHMRPSGFLAIPDDDCAEFQTPPLFSSKARDGQLPNSPHCVSLGVVGCSKGKPLSHTRKGEHRGRRGGQMRCPSCAWRCPFTF